MYNTLIYVNNATLMYLKSIGIYSTYSFDNNSPYNINSLDFLG